MKLNHETRERRVCIEMISVNGSLQYPPNGISNFTFDQAASADQMGYNSNGQINYPNMFSGLFGFPSYPTFNLIHI